MTRTMPITLPHGLNSQEIRVLQEFRRLNAETLTVDQIKAIKHPAGGGEQPATSLVSKGFLASDDSGFSLTQPAKDFLAIDAKPLVEESGEADESVDSDAL